MAIREIIHIPDPLLREVSKPVERVDDDLRKLLDDMLATMYDAPGIGLAGIQIGVPLRVVTIDVGAPDEADGDDLEAGGQPFAGEDDTGDDSSVEGRRKKERKPDPLFLINPEIVSLADAPSVYEEGCLSIPEYYAEVERPEGCTVSYIDRDGKPQTLEATGLLSTCLQHEIDHLDGRLFIDYLSKLKRDMVVRKFTKIAKQSGKPEAKRMVG